MTAREDHLGMPDLADDDGDRYGTRDQSAGSTPDQGEAELRDQNLLFGPDAASSFQQRWHEVQGRFVDDPRGAVQAADMLVSEVTQTLTAQFGAHRAALESQWSNEGDAETEDLRIALRRYRAFFQRLLAA